MFDVVLFEPEIPPNTGNILRLAANTGCRVHLIEPLGFWLDDRRLRRAGRDYLDTKNLVVHAGWDEWLAWCGDTRQLVFTAEGSRGDHEPTCSGLGSRCSSSCTASRGEICPESTRVTACVIGMSIPRACATRSTSWAVSTPSATWPSEASA